MRVSVRAPAAWPGAGRAEGGSVSGARSGSGACLAGDEVVGEQEDSGPGDGGEPGRGVEEPLHRVVEVEQPGGNPASGQRVEPRPMPVLEGIVTRSA